MNNINNPALALFTLSQDMAASRVLGTVYRNLSSKPMTVSFSVYTQNPLSANSPVVRTGPTSSPSLQITCPTIPIGTGTYSSAGTFMVPSMWYYSVTAPSATKNTWIETV